MNKNFLLSEYIRLETQIFNRDEKIASLNRLLTEVIENNFVLSLEEVIEIIESLSEKKITIRHPLFLYVLYPVLAMEVELNSIKAIKSLLFLVKYYGNCEKLTGDPKFSYWNLLTKGLALDPDDRWLLNLYEKTQKSYLEYTLHELPSGVLYDANSADSGQCDELLAELCRYEEVCKKLEIDEQELIKECKFYYTSYKTYLGNRINYKNFESFLQKNQ